MRWSIFCLCLLISPAVLGQAKESEEQPPEEEAMIDEFRTGLTSSVNATAAWLDSFFADNIDPEAYDTASGSLTLTPVWDEYDGFKLDSSFRAAVVFPHAERKFSAIIGRGDFDDFINDSQQTRPSIIRRNQSDEEWMLGLGFDPHLSQKHSLSFGAGIRGGLKLDTYLRARYRYESILGESTEASLQSVGFWRDSDGFGIAQTAEFDFVLAPNWFAKVWGRATFAERTQGVRWNTSQKLYYIYHYERAVGAEVWWSGESEHEVPLRDYGLRALHRSRFKREWLFIEGWVGLHWPRETLIETRKPRWIIGLEMEMLFGK
ncbi:hypothetical protein [Pseudidiomarina gelatinasegens]|uniref:hypothetical protein n=1 Tax=Pseudidiomarina gelatinasegens TaxID=2487740 RepID=UPI003A984FC0